MADDSVGNLVAYLTANTQELERNVKRATRRIQEYERQTGTQLSKTNREYANHAQMAKASLASIKLGIAGVVSALGAMGVGFAATKALREFSILDKGLIAVQKTTDFTAKEMITFRTELNKLAAETPVSAEGLLEIAEAAGQLGVKGVANVTNFTQTLAKLQMSSDVVGAEGAKSLARLLNTAGEGTDKIDELGAVIVELGNNMAASEKEIVHMAGEIGRGASAYKMASEDALALGAAMKSVGSRAESAGSAVSRTLIEMEKAIMEGGDAFVYLQEVTQMSGDTLRDTFKKDATEAFRAVIKGFGRMTKEGYTSVELLGKLGLSSTEVVKGLSPLIENVELMETAFGLANDQVKNATALDKEALKAAESFSAQMQITANVLDQVFVAIGQELAPVIVELANDFRTWVKENKEFIDQDLAKTIRDSAEALGLLASGLGKILGIIVKINSAAPDGLKTLLKFTAPGMGAISQISKYLGLIKEVGEEQSKEAPQRKRVSDMGGGHSNMDIFNQIEATKKKYAEDEARRTAYLAKQQREAALATAELKKKTLVEFQTFYDDIMLSSYDLDKQELDASVAKLRAVLGDKAEIQTAYDTKLKELKQQRDERRTARVDAFLASYFADLEKKLAKAREYYKKKKEIQADFAAAQRETFLSATDQEKYALKERYKYFKKGVEDKVALKRWFLANMKEIDKKVNDANLTFSETIAKGGALAMKKIKAETMETSEMIASGLGTAIDGVSTALSEWASGAKTAKEAFKDMAASIVKDIASMIAKQLVLNAVKAVGSMFGEGGTFGDTTAATPAAKGAAFAKGSAFTNTIVKEPTMFAFAKGDSMGVMGEAGPEAIMPLSRGAGGKLGVSVDGTAAPAPAAPEVNLKNINVFDASVVGDYLDTAEGEEVVVNIMQKNKQST